MTFLPIVERELRVASRLKGTHRLRWGLAAVAILFACGAIGMSDSLASGSFNGQILFYTLSVPIGLYCLFDITKSSDSISEEKREGTLGLLFLTDLKGYDIVAGKLAGCMISSLYAVIATVPLMAFSLMLGGITGAQVFKMALAMVNGLFFTHCGAIMVSSFCKETRNAHANGLGLSILFSLLLPVTTALIVSHYPKGLFLLYFCPSSPMISSAAPAPLKETYWSSLALTHLMAWLFFLIACRQTPCSWQEKAGKNQMAWRDRLRQWHFGSPKQRLARRTQLLGENPYCWLILRSKWSPFMAWIIVVLVLGLTGIGSFALYLVEHKKEGSFIVWLYGLGIIHMVLKLSLAGSATAMLEGQKRNGGLELLLSGTPLSTKDILQGCWLALRKVFYKPVLLILAIDLLVCVTMFCVANRDIQHSLILFASLSVTMLPLDLFALGWTGLWVGVASKKKHAQGGAILRVLGLPMILFTMLNALHEIFFPHIQIPDWFAVLIWTALGIGFDFYFITRSRAKILKYFRLVAVARDDELKIALRSTVPVATPLNQ